MSESGVPDASNIWSILDPRNVLKDPKNTFKYSIILLGFYLATVVFFKYALLEKQEFYTTQIIINKSGKIESPLAGVTAKVTACRNLYNILLFPNFIYFSEHSDKNGKFSIRIPPDSNLKLEKEKFHRVRVDGEEVDKIYFQSNASSITLTSNPATIVDKNFFSYQIMIKDQENKEIYLSNPKKYIKFSDTLGTILDFRDNEKISSHEQQVALKGFVGQIEAKAEILPNSEGNQGKACITIPVRKTVSAGDILAYNSAMPGKGTLPPVSLELKEPRKVFSLPFTLSVNSPHEFFFKYSQMGNCSLCIEFLGAIFSLGGDGKNKVELVSSDLILDKKYSDHNDNIQTLSSELPTGTEIDVLLTVSGQTQANEANNLIYNFNFSYKKIGSDVPFEEDATFAFVSDPSDARHMGEYPIKLFMKKNSDPQNGNKALIAVKKVRYY